MDICYNMAGLEVANDIPTSPERLTTRQQQDPELRYTSQAQQIIQTISSSSCLARWLLLHKPSLQLIHLLRPGPAHVGRLPILLSHQMPQFG